MSAAALDAYLGNEAQKAALTKALQNKTLPHAVLISAPDGCGRNFFARCLAADALYPAGGEGAAAVLRGQSAEVLLVEGEGPSGLIKIDRVRQVRSDMYRTGLSAAGRAVLIRDAERMMAPAANALLKVLEEPPGEVLFIVTARDAVALPATIRSRCAIYPLAPLQEAQCQSALQKQGAGAEEAAFLAGVYAGRLGLGLRVLAGEERGAVLQDAARAATAAAARDRYGLLSLFSRYEGRGDEERERRFALLDDMASLLAAALRGSPAVAQMGLGPEAATAYLPPIQKARAALMGNAAAKLTLTALAVQFTKEVL